jgi:hypothetical protein
MLPIVLSLGLPWTPGVLPWGLLRYLLPTVVTTDVRCASVHQLVVDNRWPTETDVSKSDYRPAGRKNRQFSTSLFPV